jgi:hypothetical protein
VNDVVDGIHARLDGQIDDWQARLVLADLLDDIGDPRAAGYRAMGRLRLWPLLRSKGLYGGDPDDAMERLWQWWLDVRPRHAKKGESAHCGIPGPWCKAINALHPHHANCTHHTRRAAEDALALAFSHLSPAEQAEILTEADQ